MCLPGREELSFVNLVPGANSAISGSQSQSLLLAGSALRKGGSWVSFGNWESMLLGLDIASSSQPWRLCSCTHNASTRVTGDKGWLHQLAGSFSIRAIPWWVLLVGVTT